MKKLLAEKFCLFSCLLDIIKAHFAAKDTGDMGDQDKEEETNIIKNKEYSGNTHDKVSEENIPSGDKDEVPILNPGGNHYVFTLPH